MVVMKAVFLNNLIAGILETRSGKLVIFLDNYGRGYPLWRPVDIPSFIHIAELFEKITFIVGESLIRIKLEIIVEI